MNFILYFIIDPTAVQDLEVLRISNDNSVSVRWGRPISTGSAEFNYLVRYNGKNVTVLHKEEDEKPFYFFKIEKPENLVINVEVN